MEVKTKIRYRWKAEPTACETCRKLDGTEYNSTNQIPKRPHPNCRCVIEPIEEVEKGYEDVERIDTIDKKITVIGHSEGGSEARQPQGQIYVINGTGGPKNRHGINNMGDLRDAVLKAPKSRVRWSRKRYF